jgi:hypothetical protein
MALSRRQFFRRFLGPDKENHQRLVRYEALEAHVRTRLLPYDFSLSEQQEVELFADVRAALESISNDELFTTAVPERLEEIVELKLQPWRAESWERFQSERIREIRESAPDYVTAFLTMQATVATIDKLKARFGAEDASALEAELRKRIQAWVASADDERILQYDIFTIKDLVFAQLRSWC